MPPSRTRERGHVGLRLLSGSGLIGGLVLAVRPGAVLDLVDQAFPRERRWLARLLGARLVAQHSAVLLRPDAAVLTAAAGVELLHAASMLPFIGSARYGRAARISGAVALGSAVLARRATAR